MKKLMNWLKEEESGQGMVEYGLILALIAVVVIAALNVLGPKVAETFNNVSGKMS
ncbi:MAG: Flp family type IVb pilin [Sedimentibacter sp.]|uniref:Flp family type IVb pilin n=1 Tax=Sedimentibacter sp. TaxID=1960295 RepID=UPI003158E0D0